MLECYLSSKLIHVNTWNSCIGTADWNDDPRSFYRYLSSSKKGPKHAVHCSGITEVGVRVTFRPFSLLLFKVARKTARIICLTSLQCWCCVLRWLQNFGKSLDTQERKKWVVATALQVEFSNFCSKRLFFMPRLLQMWKGSRNSCIASTSQDQVCLFDVFHLLPSRSMFFDQTLLNKAPRL